MRCGVLMLWVRVFGVVVSRCGVRCLVCMFGGCWRMCGLVNVSGCEAVEFNAMRMKLIGRGKFRAG